MHREANRVRDQTLLENLVIAHQSGKDRQPGGIRGSPARRSQGIRIQVKDGPAVRFPTGAVVERERVTEFVEFPGIAVELSN